MVTKARRSAFNAVEAGMLTEATLAQIMKHASRQRLHDFTPWLVQAMEEFGISANLRRAAAFVAQLAHESGEFRWMEEIWGPTDAQNRYEPVTTLSKRLGNTQPGDGKRFKGRGPIQLTGRANYQAFGDKLGVDLIGDPQSAARPELGFRIAGLFWSRNGLNERADADDFVGITRRINGGTNGLAERTRYYQLALQVLASAFPAAAAPASSGSAPRGGRRSFARGMEAVRLADGGRPKPLPAPKGAGRRKADRAPSAAGPGRVFDARPDTMDFRDLMYVPTLVEVPTHVPLGDYLEWNVPMLDQGTEGACTGYGLATVANYLLLRRRVLPDPMPVSARMLYDLARRYDEWPGEKYEGSSARGAMKGWHKHGICREELYQSKGPAVTSGLTEERTSEARRRPLGAYFRVNHKDLVAMHTALAEVGVLYATAVVHQGWSDVGPDGVIERSDQVLGGHAFAIVAYDEDGFWIQNSWGADWGSGGFARIGYDDWLLNGTDVWVARLGAPVKLLTAAGTAAAHADSAGRSAAYSFNDLRPHIVSVGNDGLLRAGGDYGTTPADLAQIFSGDIPRVTAPWSKRRILLYAHGGLVSESSAVQRLADYRQALLDAEVYPIAFIWKTDAWTTLTNILKDAIRRRRPEGVLDAAKDFMLDRLDDALEPLARTLGGKALWDEMKENARLASASAQGAAQQLVAQLAALNGDGKGLEIHLAGHSAGAIFLGPVVGLLLRGGHKITSCSLWAPACSHELFASDYLQAIKDGDIARFALYVLGDKAEQDDHCARIYNKSLLYLVSHALETPARIPVFRPGVPILGLERWLAPELRQLLTSGAHRLVVAPDGSGAGALSTARHHGDFDDDPATVASTLAFMLDGKTRMRAAAAAGAAGELTFRSSGSALRDRREGIDQRTRG
jgi:predicted chitinase